MVRIVLLRLMESYFRHRWLYLIPLVIAVGAGSYYVATAPPKYVAVGRLYVEKDSLLAALTSTSNDGALWVTAAQATTNEIDELVASRAFTRSAIQKTDLEQNMSGGAEEVDRTVTYFRDALYIQPRGDKLVEISATSEDPNLAYQMVVAIMESYVQWKLNSDFRESVAAQSFFEAQIPPYQDEVDQSRAALLDFLNANPQPVRGDRPIQEQMELDRLQSALRRAEDQLAGAQDNEESARLAQVKSESVTRQTYLVIDQPQLPTEADFSLKDVARDMAIFLGIGTFLSLAGIIANALLDRSLRFPIDVRHSLSLPVLAMVPTASKSPMSTPTERATRRGDQPASESTKQADPSLQPQI